MCCENSGITTFIIIVEALQINAFTFVMNDLSVVPDYGVVSHRNALDQKSFNFNFNRSNLILWCIEVGW